MGCTFSVSAGYPFLLTINLNRLRHRYNCRRGCGARRPVPVPTLRPRGGQPATRPLIIAWLCMLPLSIRHSIPIHYDTATIAVEAAGQAILSQFRLSILEGNNQLRALSSPVASAAISGALHMTTEARRSHFATACCPRRANTGKPAPEAKTYGRRTQQGPERRHLVACYVSIDHTFARNVMLLALNTAWLHEKAVSRPVRSAVYAPVAPAVPLMTDRELTPVVTPSVLQDSVRATHSLTSLRVHGA